MGIPDVHAAQYGSTERASERVARAYSVCHLYYRGLLEGHAAGCEHVAAVDAACQHKHVKVVLAKYQPALVAHVKTRIAEQAAYHDELLVVYLQYVAALHRLAYHFLRVEVLAKVDVEYLQDALV